MLYKLTDSHKKYVLIDFVNKEKSPIFGWKCFSCIRYLKAKDFRMVASILFLMTEIEDDDVLLLNNLIRNAEDINGRYGYQKKHTKATGRPKKEL